MATTRGRRLIALNGVLVLATAATMAWEIPQAVGFFARAHAHFWALAGLALLVDLPMAVGLRATTRTRAPLSVAVTFAIFILFGSGPAFVVQAVVIAVTAILQRAAAPTIVFYATRILLAIGVADLLVADADNRPRPREGALAGADFLWILQLAGVWFVVTYGLVVVFGLVADPRGFRVAAQASRDDLMVSGVALVLATPLIVALPHWWDLVVAAPLLVWGLSLRLRTGQERLLLQEPRTRLLNRRGLDTLVTEITAQDSFHERRFALVTVQAAEALPTLSRALGRDIYEELVAAFSHRLAQAFGRERVAGPLGEGFAILVPDRGREDPAVVAVIAARELSAPVEVNGIPFRLHCSAGVALSPEHARDLDGLLVKAEHAVTSAHQQDRPVLVYVPDTEARAQRRTTLLAELYAVLTDPARGGELTVLYQPQVDLDTGDLVGAEALVRWTHPRWGPVPTDEFIDAIERTEVMHLLTRRVLAVAIAQARAWVERGPRIRVSVNASVQDLRDPEFPDEIAATLAEHGVDPAQLTIEVTERMALLDSVRVARAAAAIRHLGAGLSIDDFGTGYASMQQLQQLPVTEVKIDKSYVDGMLTNPRRHAIVTAVHQLSAALGLEIVAEGVEDEATAAGLRGLGRVIGQGYLFGRPMPADALVATFSQRSREQEAAARRRGSPRRWSRQRS